MKRIFIIIFLLLLMVGIGTKADSIPLVDLLDGQTLQVEDKLFSDWTLIFAGGSHDEFDPDLNVIEVLPLSGQPMNPGLQYVMNGALAVDGVEGSASGLEIGFTVTSLDPGLLINDASLELTEYFVNGGGAVALITETGFDEADSTVFFLAVQDDPLLGNFDLFDSDEFAFQRSVSIETTIFVQGDFPTNSASIDAFEQRFSQVAAPVPEPSTLLLLATGLVGLAGFRRKLRKE